MRNELLMRLQMGAGKNQAENQDGERGLSGRQYPVRHPELECGTTCTVDQKLYR